MGFTPPLPFTFPQPGYGTETVANVNAANAPAAYSAKPSDYAILLDLTGYGGAGPTISLLPLEDAPVLVRNVLGSGASHNWVVQGPAGTTIENPATPGTFAASVTFSSANTGGTWIFDRQNARFVVYTQSGGGGGGGVTWANDLAGSSNTNQWVASISGPGGAGGIVPINATTLQFASGQAQPTVSQAQTASVNGQRLVVQSQGSSATNGTPGNIRMSLQNPNGTGTVPFFEVTHGNVLGAALGENSNSNTLEALWLLPPSFGQAETGTNFAAQVQANGYLVLNAPIGTNVWITFQNSATNPTAFTTTGVEFFSVTTDFGGGNGVMAMAPVTTVPNALPTSSVVWWTNANRSLGLSAVGIQFSTLVTGLVNITQDIATGNIAPTTLQVQAQSASLSSSTNTTGGELSLLSGEGQNAGGHTGFFLLGGLQTGGGGGPGNTNDIQMRARSIGGVPNDPTTSHVPWAWTNASVTIGTTGTTTLSISQSNAPVIRIPAVTLTGNVTIAFPNTPGFWLVDVSAIVMGANTVTFSSGTATSAAYAAADIGSTVTKQKIVTVLAYGANTIATNV